jgi:predicted dehydrogenase
MGVNLDYPRGEPDRLSLAQRGRAWKPIAVRGSWFVDAFRGTMQSLQRFAAGEDATLPTSVSDAIHTMALVEACYRSSSRPATSLPLVRPPHA